VSAAGCGNESEASTAATPIGRGIEKRVDWQTELVRRGSSELRAGKGAGLEPLGANFGRQEPMPKAMRYRIRQNLGNISALGLNFKTSHYVTTSMGISVWIVNGRDVTCLFRERSAASSCRTRVAAEREGIWLGTYSTSKARPGQPVDYLAVGVAPGTVNSVVVGTGTTRKTLHLKAHAWALRGRNPIYLEKITR